MSVAGLEGWHTVKQWRPLLKYLTRASELLKSGEKPLFSLDLTFISLWWPNMADCSEREAMFERLSFCLTKKWPISLAITGADMIVNVLDSFDRTAGARACACVRGCVWTCKV